MKVRISKAQFSHLTKVFRNSKLVTLTKQTMKQASKFATNAKQAATKLNKNRNIVDRFAAPYEALCKLLFGKYPDQLSDQEKVVSFVVYALFLSLLSYSIFRKVPQLVFTTLTAAVLVKYDIAQIFDKALNSKWITFIAVCAIIMGFILDAQKPLMTSTPSAIALPVIATGAAILSKFIAKLMHKISSYAKRKNAYALSLIMMTFVYDVWKILLKLGFNIAIEITDK